MSENNSFTRANRGQKIGYQGFRGNGKSIATLLAMAKKTGCLEEILRELKARESGDRDVI